jgi:hypothetical protein
MEKDTGRGPRWTRKAQTVVTFSVISLAWAYVAWTVASDGTRDHMAVVPPAMLAAFFCGLSVATDFWMGDGK